MVLGERPQGVELLQLLTKLMGKREGGGGGGAVWVWVFFFG
jgi:hypothetical protein